MQNNLILKMLTQIITIAFLVYLFFGLLLFLRQCQYIYYPDKQDFNSCPGFKNSQKINHNGTRFYYKQNSDKLIVFYHGNAGSACDRSFLANIFEGNGYSYIFVEYAGYSGDDKKPSEKLILKDVVNVNDFIKTINYSELIIGAESIGSGPASFHTTINKVNKLILIAPFTNLADVAREIYFMYPIKLLLKDNYDNIKWLQNFNGKLMIIHGAADKIIPNKFSKKLFESVSTADKQYIEIDGAGHNDIYSYEEVLNNIIDFVKN